MNFERKREKETTNQHIDHLLAKKQDTGEKGTYIKKERHSYQTQVVITKGIMVRIDQVQ